MFRKFAKTLAIGAVISLLPISAMALEALNDDAMMDVTGQAGVSIAIDDVEIWQTVADVTYTDTDGNGTNYADTGAPALYHKGEVTIAYSQGAGVKTSINSMVNFTRTDTKESDSSTNTVSEWVDVDDVATHTMAAAGDGWIAGTSISKSGNALTIDVGQATTFNTLKDTTVDADNIGSTAVIIGLPTLEIKTAYESDYYQKVMIGGKEAIQISMADSTMRIQSGTVEIAAH